MSPLSVSNGRSQRALAAGESTLWLLLMGVNAYQDPRLPMLRYSAGDCQGLSQALLQATQRFPRREVKILHDAGSDRPLYSSVCTHLQRMAVEAKPQDTLLIYFSGHGLLMPDQQQVALCLADTDTDHLAETALSLQKLLQHLGQSAAQKQIVWLDACHSGGMTLFGAKGRPEQAAIANPTSQLIQVLGQRATQSKGFYALLSCDQAQQAWEFPELGHGVFTYFLMQGLSGEAADPQGIIEVDALYRYVYYQTLHYIDQANQHLRLLNQQKRSRGDVPLHPEYPLQTPKRIVEGFGEFILGVKPLDAPEAPQRRSLILDGLGHCQTALELGKMLQGDGEFTVAYWPNPGQITLAALQTCIQEVLGGSTDTEAPPDTVFLYLRSHLEETESGEVVFVMEDGIRLSCSWLRQHLRRSPAKQKIVVLDCPQRVEPSIANEHNPATLLNLCVEDLQLDRQGQCLLAAASPLQVPEQFAQTVLQSLTSPEGGMGLTAANWISQLQVALAAVKIPLQVWVSSAQGVLHILPAKRQKPLAADRGLDIGLCPYLGLKAFSEADAAYFYGREALTEELLNRLATQSFLAVVGASGSGKSSLVQAGVVRSLKQGQKIAESETWAVRCLRPGAHPLAALAGAWVDPGTETEQTHQQLQLEGILYQGVESFVYWIRQRPEPMLVLVVDQFEELFTLASAAERSQFLESVLGAVSHAGDRFKLVITIRVDFVAASLAIPALAEAIQQTNVFVPSSLSAADYRRIIIQPGEQVGLQVESELVEVLLQDLNQSAGELPLLEFVLQQLWEQRSHGKLTLDAYLQHIGGLRGALERACQTVYASLDPDAQHCAQWIFLTLTHIGEGNDYTRRRVPKSAFIMAKYPADLVERTLQVLTASKLVVIDFELGGRSLGQSRNATDAPSEEEEIQSLLQQEVTVEVAHEILIRHWSTLRWWLDENRLLLQRQRQLAQAAQLWHQHGQQPEFLLQGIRLAEAEDVYIKHTDELSSESQRFVEACLDARQAQQRQAQKRLRQAQLTAVVMGGLGIAALGFGGIAFWQKQAAQARAIEALNASAEAQMLSYQQLEALGLSVKAGRQLQQMIGVPASLQQETRQRLTQTLQATQEINRIEGHRSDVIDIAYHPHEQSFASVSEDDTVKLWKEDGSLLKTFPGGVGITRVVFSPDGQQLAIATAKGTIQLWDSSGHLRQSFQGHQGWITSLAVSPKGEYLVSAGDDKFLKRWDWQGHLQKTYRGHSAGVSSINVSPDGRNLVSGSLDGTIQLWRTNGHRLKTLKGHQDEITEVTFSPDGQWVASASADRTIRLWQVATGAAETLTRKARGAHSHRDRINSIQFSPDGKWLASASADGTIGLWQPGKPLQNSLKGHGGVVNRVVFSPDGKTLASVSSDASIRLWQASGKKSSNPADADLQTLLRLSCNHLRSYLKTNPNVSVSDRLLCD
jgi:uncharacterized caspase-like protein/WD40 repeat protein/energy-coupling factor transporter ATP-binding protein EcfA2